jgi:hypothetical protein
MIQSSGSVKYFLFLIIAIVFFFTYKEFQSNNRLKNVINEKILSINSKTEKNIIENIQIETAGEKKQLKQESDLRLFSSSSFVIKLIKISYFVFF